LNIENKADIVSLEPIIGFATLDYTSTSNHFDGKIFTFRRINDQYAEYGLCIETLIPKERVAYCIECLQYLWDRRAHAWLAREKFEESLAGSENAFESFHYFAQPGVVSSFSNRNVVEPITTVEFGEHGAGEDIEYCLDDCDGDDEDAPSLEKSDMDGSTGRVCSIILTRLQPVHA